MTSLNLLPSHENNLYSDTQQKRYPVLRYCPNAYCILYENATWRNCVWDSTPAAEQLDLDLWTSIVSLFAAGSNQHLVLKCNYTTEIIWQRVYQSYNGLGFAFGCTGHRSWWFKKWPCMCLSGGDTLQLVVLYKGNLFHVFLLLRYVQPTRIRSISFFLEFCTNVDIGWHRSKDSISCPDPTPSASIAQSFPFVDEHVPDWQ